MVSDPNGVTFWDVRIDLPQLYGPQPQGSMIITKTHPNGGIFTSTFAIQPLLTFTDVGGQGVRVLDCTSPPSGYTCPTIELRAENVPWTHKVPRALYESRGFCPSCGPNGERLQMIMTYHDQGVDRSLMSYLPALRM